MDEYRPGQEPLSLEPHASCVACAAGAGGQGKIVSSAKAKRHNEGMGSRRPTQTLAQSAFHAIHARTHARIQNRRTVEYCATTHVTHWKNPPRSRAGTNHISRKPTILRVQLFSSSFFFPLSVVRVVPCNQVMNVRRFPCCYAYLYSILRTCTPYPYRVVLLRWLLCEAGIGSHAQGLGHC